MNFFDSEEIDEAYCELLHAIFYMKDNLPARNIYHVIANQKLQFERTYRLTTTEREHGQHPPKGNEHANHLETFSRNQR